MNKKVVSGYIVVNTHGRPLELDRHGEGEPLILLWGDQATVFSERRTARNAIRRTQRYARTRLNDPADVWFDQSIVPLIVEER